MPLFVAFVCSCENLSKFNAERLLKLGLAALKIQVKHLVGAPKGTLEKQVLGWWLRRHTTAGRRWVSGRLRMGDESRVTRGIRLVKNSGGPEVERLKKRLARVLK